MRKAIRYNDFFRLSEENPMDGLAGVSIDGIHYYDFKNVQYLNNTGMATLIDLLKCVLERGERAQFVNVNEKVKSKIKSLGLENIINCS